MPRGLPVAIVVVAVAAVAGVALLLRGVDDRARCAEGFVAREGRCRIEGACPAPLVETPHGCDAPDVRVTVPAAELAIGPSDWEAEGRVVPRTIRTAAFRVDAFEVTRGAMGEVGAADDTARAASGMSRDEAAAFCATRGGRLPTEDEWIVAAASGASPPHRYPWGDTGAVCRRAAWGLARGPCAEGVAGPDAVGAHPDGDSPLGLHDLAGNVAEWIAAPESSGSGVAMAKGGSFATSLAADLRLWARLELPGPGGDPRVGVRCVYAP